MKHRPDEEGAPVPRSKKPYRLWKEDRSVFYWCSPESPAWKSTRCTSEEKAEACVLKQLRDPPLDTERMSLRQYLEPYYVWDSCPHVARLKAENKQIGRGHVTESRQALEKYVFTDPIAGVAVGQL
jgi:hypothetical protein